MTAGITVDQLHSFTARNNNGKVTMLSMKRKAAAAVDGRMTLVATGMNIMPAPNPAKPLTQPATKSTVARNSSKPGAKELNIPAIAAHVTRV